MDDIQIVTIIMALYGALLSSTLAAYKFYENWRRLKVKLSLGKPYNAGIVYGPGWTIGDRPVLLLSCSNPGKRSITITSHGIALPNKKKIFMANSQGLPRTLSDGQGHISNIGLTEIKEWLVQEVCRDSVKLIGFFADATGKRYYGKEFKFSIS